MQNKTENAKIKSPQQPDILISLSYS